MNYRGERLLEATAAVALVLYPPVAAVLLISRGLLLRRARLNRAWLFAWGWLLVLGLFVLARERDAGLLLQAILGVIAGSFLFVHWRRTFLVGLLVGFSIVLLVGVAAREQSRIQWNDSSEPQTLSQLITRTSKLSGDSAGWRRNGVRLIEKSWLLNSNVQLLELRLDLRDIGSTHGWQWYTNSASTKQELKSEAGLPYTHVTNLNSYLARRARTTAPLGGKSVRASLELRASAAITHEGCALQLRTFDPPLSICEPLTLDDSWHSYEMLFSFPSEATHTIFDITIAEVDVEYLDIRSLAIETLEEDVWTPVAVLEPDGVLISFPQSGAHLYSYPTLHINPTPEWQSYSLKIESAAPTTQQQISAVLQLDAGTAIEVRNVSLLAGPPGAQQQLVPTSWARSGLWFEQPNLAGHTMATLGVLGLIVSPAPGIGFTSVAVLVASVGAVSLTGSRAAWLGVLVGGAWVLWLRLTRRGRRAMALTALFAALAIAGIGEFRTGGRLQFTDLQDRSSVTRFEIWRVAWAGFMDSPFIGKGTGGFASAWHSHRPEDLREAPTHAHNLWLELALRYGLLGLSGILWLNGCLLRLAWKRGRWQGLVLVTSVLLMNFLDYSFTYSGVLFPLTLGINALGNRQG